MKIWQLSYPHNLQHVTSPDLKRPENKIKVKVTKALLSESDVAVYSGLQKVNTPFIPGRFAIGQVTEADQDSFIRKGERVYLAGTTEDECAPDGLRIAGETADGFYRDFVLAGIDDVYPLPASVSDEAAFLIDAIALAEHVVDEMQIDVGQHILVVGGGLYGNILCQILIYHRAVPILADNNPERLARAKRSGIYYTFPNDDTLKSRVLEVTGGKLADGREWIGSSSGWIYATLAKHAADPKNIQVAGWLITHVHSDHAGGLYDMALGYHGTKNGTKHTVMPKEIKQYIKIDKIIYNQPATTKFGRNGWMETIIKAFNVKNVVKAHPGQVFYCADLKLTIYGSQDVMLEKSGSSGDLNDFSVVSRAEINGKSALFLGDSDTIPNPRLAAIYKETLKSDLLQLAHHGYGDTGDADVNSYCDPSMVLWVVSNRDLRSNYKINTNSSISSLKNAKNYNPGTGNLIFRKDWSTYSESASTIINMIPKCDGTHCGNKNCSKKTSTWNSYNS